MKPTATWEVDIHTAILCPSGQEWRTYKKEIGSARRCKELVAEFYSEKRHTWTVLADKKRHHHLRARIYSGAGAALEWEFSYSPSTAAIDRGATLKQIRWTRGNGKPRSEQSGRHIPDDFDPLFPFSAEEQATFRSLPAMPDFFVAEHGDYDALYSALKLPEAWWGPLSAKIMHGLTHPGLLQWHPDSHLALMCRDIPAPHDALIAEIRKRTGASVCDQPLKQQIERFGLTMDTISGKRNPDSSERQSKWLLPNGKAGSIEDVAAHHLAAEGYELDANEGLPIAMIHDVLTIGYLQATGDRIWHLLNKTAACIRNPIEHLNRVQSFLTNASDADFTRWLKQWQSPSFRLQKKENAPPKGEYARFADSAQAYSLYSTELKVQYGDFLARLWRSGGREFFLQAYRFQMVSKTAYVGGSGYPDITAIKDGNLHFFEVKGSDKLIRSQIDWLRNFAGPMRLNVKLIKVCAA